MPESEKAWFFAESGSTYKRAKDICHPCPVRGKCLDLAMDLEGRGLGVHEGRRFGVWGGLSGRERSRLAKEPA